MDKVFKATRLRPSVTVAVKAKVPGPVGVPEITPADESDRPGGRLLPPAKVHEYEVRPPLALRVLLGYDWPTVP